MANARNAIDTALYELLSATTALLNVAPGGVHNTVAPRDAKYPMVVFQAITKLDEHTFSGRFANAVYLVKAISKSPWPKEAGTIDTQIDAVLEDASLSISGFTQLLCRRTEDFYFPEDEGGAVYQHQGGMYNIVADQT